MRTIKIGKRYKHFKGTIYKVLCIAKDSETLAKKVVYTHNDEIWVRDYDMFNSLVDKEKYPDEKAKYRFTEIK
ncbi:MAG: DUF1653 domain-containing protein [Bacilli bacterium]|nr:DUF1653 domain-containing protein [Bacilli bacterium]